jgi:hypothetical protein
MEIAFTIISAIIGLIIASKFNIIAFGSNISDILGRGCGAFLGIWMLATVIVFSLLSKIWG